MATIEFPSGLKVRTFASAPAGFAPLKAEAHELFYHGYPRRPVEHPELLHRWEHVLSRPFRYIVPTFTLMKNKVHGPRAPKGINSVESSPNWSGAVVFAPRGATMKWVEGDWTVPNPQSPADDGNWYYCSSWVGIDGDGSTDVFQAGVETEAMLSRGVTSRNIYAWWEWYPGDEVKIDNFPVAAGDKLSFLLCIDDQSTTAGYMFLYNETSSAATSFAVTAPSGTTLTGNCAEWIVERPGFRVNGAIKYGNLARYSTVLFTNAISGATNNALVDGGTGDSIKMHDDSGTTISTGILESKTTVLCVCDL